jgi:hypothetical protein
MQSGWGWRVLQEVRALTRRITRREEPTLSIGVMKLAMLLVWLMMGFGLLLAIALPVYPHGGGEGSSQSKRKSGTLTER